GRPSGGRREDHAGLRPVRRRGDDPDARRLRGRRRRGLRCRRRFELPRQDGRDAPAQPDPPPRGRQDDRAPQRPPARVGAHALGGGADRAGRQAGRDRLRPRERRRQREARLRGGARGSSAELRAADRGRLRDRAERAGARREDRAHGRHPGRLRPGDTRPRDGRPAEDDAVEPALLGHRPAGRRDPEGRAGWEGRSRALRGRAARARRLRPDDLRDRAQGRRRRAGLVPRHGLERPLVPRLAGVLPAHGRVGQPEALIEGRARRLRLGPPLGDGQRAVRGRRDARDRREGDRRPRQRAARRPIARRAGMSSFEVEQPILNSPFDEPREHWLIEEGKPPTRAPGRRRAGYFYRDPGGPEPDPGQAVRGQWQELELVNLIRERLASWREAGYPGASRTTLDLIRHWRRDGRKRRLFFAQLEAAETLIFLREARPDLLQGIEIPPDTAPEGVEAFTRYACKMATGSGKTTVMGMLCAWSILNKVAARSDARFSDVVVVVCPNLTIRGRLQELDPNRGEASIYRTLDLVPQHLMSNLRRGRVLVKNWPEFERKGMSAGAKVQRAGVPEVVRATVKIGPKTTSGRGGRYMTEKALDVAVLQGMRILEDRRPDKQEVLVEETRYVESDAKLMQRLLGREVGGKQNILVLNDEAHHAYRIRGKDATDAADDAEALNEELADEY